MRPIWEGGISFGLIYIPIKLYSATQPIQIDLDFLSKKDLSPIRYVRIDVATGKEVPWKDVVKGYKYKKGDYVVLDSEDFEKVIPEKSTAIDISCFVNTDDIDPIYFDKPYYLEPSKGSEKTYRLFLEALKESNKVGISQFVLRNREHLFVVKPEKNLLILNQLRYQSEIKSPNQLDLPLKLETNKKELDMAINLIDGMTEKFDPSEYKDDYIIGLKKIIEAKAQHRTVKTKPVPTRTKTESTDLMEQLRKSLEHIKVKEVER